MKLTKYRVVKEKYGGISKYYPEYKFVLFPFVWLRWQDDKIVYEDYINFITFADCLEYINHKRHPIKVIPPKKEIDIFKVDL